MVIIAVLLAVAFGSCAPTLREVDVTVKVDSEKTATPLAVAEPFDPPASAGPATADSIGPGVASPININQDVSDRSLIQLIDPLDEPEFYCVDVPGFGSNLHLGAALMAHTCKPGADDEIFAVNQPHAGNLYMPAYDRCLQADSTHDPVNIYLRACSGDSLQRFTLTPAGAIRLTVHDLCLALSPGDGEPTGGPSHLRRGLALQRCGEADSALARWKFPGPEPN